MNKIRACGEIFLILVSIFSWVMTHGLKISYQGSQDEESRSQEPDWYLFFKMGKYSKFGCEWQSTKNKPKLAPIPNFGLHSLFFFEVSEQCNARIGSWKSYQLDHNDCQICFRTTLLIFSLIYKTKEVQSCLWQDENLEFLLNWDIQCWGWGQLLKITENPRI